MGDIDDCYGYSKYRCREPEEFFGTNNIQREMGVEPLKRRVLSTNSITKA